MCTVSWAFHEEGYELVFNRDESKRRQRALAPRVFHKEGCRWIAPEDPAGGGSWIALNDRGLCVCLLNHYEAESRYEPASPASRGALPVMLAEASGIADGTARLGSLDLAAYRPFIVCLVDPTGADSFVWNGRRLERADTRARLATTSSFRSGEVQGYRQERFREMAGQGRGLLDFQLDRSHADAAFNPLMLRDDARTHSISEIWIDRERVRFTYHDRPEDAFALEPAIALAMDRVVDR